MGANPLKRNPAELVLMSANPRKRGGAMKYAVKWNTGTISRAVDTHDEAEKMLAQFHGAGRVIRVNPIELLRGNPIGTTDSSEAEDARAIRSGFVHKETSNFIVVNEPHIKHSGDYAELGILFSLSVKGFEAVRVLQLEKQGIRVISDTSRRQIYFVGAVRMSAMELAQFNKYGGNVIELGECREIIYLARKYHPEVGSSAAGKLIEWHHKFGEETGVVPKLFYDAKSSRLILRGGEYTVEDAGLVN